MSMTEIWDLVYEPDVVFFSAIHRIAEKDSFRKPSFWHREFS